jgi:serine/threonine protein phosphatase PrpC
MAAAANDIKSDEKVPALVTQMKHGRWAERGSRPTMEDELFAFDSIELKGARVKSMLVTAPISAYGIFDGHNGRGAAEYSRKWCIPLLVECLRDGFTAPDALRFAVRKTEEFFLKEFPSDESGCTATILLIDGNGEYYCANAGDSRCILIGSGRTDPATVLSVDHKPTRADEKARIEAAGGTVIRSTVLASSGDGMLAVSRAIGDRKFKPFVISEPEIRSGQVQTGDECFVLASDGLFDVMSNSQIAIWCALALKVDNKKSIVKRSLSKTIANEKEYAIVEDALKSSKLMAETVSSSANATSVALAAGAIGATASASVDQKKLSTEPDVLHLKCKHLVDFAINNCRSKDNVSVIIVRLPAPSSTNRKHENEEVSSTASTESLEHDSEPREQDEASTGARQASKPVKSSSLAAPKRIKSSSVAAASAPAAASVKSLSLPASARGRKK